MVAGNIKGCGGYFLASHLLKEKMGVQFIPQVSELVCTEVTSLVLHFTDSKFFSPAFPKLWVSGSAQFFSTAQNLSYMGPLRPPEHYGVDVLQA